MRHRMRWWLFLHAPYGVYRTYVLAWCHTKDRHFYDCPLCKHLPPGSLERATRMLEKTDTG
jgi:hypothetical protein